MKDFICIGNSPINEKCVSVDKDVPYLNEMREECQRFRDGLDNYFEYLKDSGVYFWVKQFQHDFGPYFEVVVYFDNDSKEQADIAFEIESNIPETWDELENMKYERNK